MKPSLISHRLLMILSVAYIVAIAPVALANEAADHPLVGRFDEAVIHHQEVSRFGEYTIAVDETETIRIEGEVWMTLYNAPKDSSTFSIYSTYPSFLEQKGFEIVLSYRPNETPQGYLATVYDRAPFANHGNYSHSAPITRGSSAMAAYLAARRDNADGSVYVSIAIAAGWGSYPQLKLDVVQTSANVGRIVSTGTRTARDAEDSTREPGSVAALPGAPEDGLPAGRGSFRLRSGLAAYMLLDSGIAGELAVSSDGDPITPDDTASKGFKNVFGPFAEAAWFINPNVGLMVNFTKLASDVTLTVGDDSSQSKSELTIFRTGVISRMVGRSYPSTIGVGFGGGVAIANLVLEERIGASHPYTHAESVSPVFSAAVEMAIPVVGFAIFTTGIEYLFIPFDKLVFREAGSLNSRTIYEGNLGGLILQIGLVVEL